MVRKIPATDSLADLGYQHIMGGAYRASWSNSEVEHFIYLERGRPAAPPHASFGLRNSDAELFAIKCVIRYGWSFFQTLLDHRENSDCLMRFSFARFDPFWNRKPVLLRRLGEPAFAAAVKQVAEHQLLPLIRDVTSKEKLFAVLMSDDEPFRWIVTNGAIRAAIVVAVGAQIGLPPREVQSQLQSKASWISVGLSKHSPFVKAPNEYVERVQQDWTSGIT